MIERKSARAREREREHAHEQERERKREETLKVGAKQMVLSENIQNTRLFDCSSFS